MTNCAFAQWLDAAGAGLTRGFLGIWRTGGRRRIVVGFAALALILQGLSLFTPMTRLSPAEAAFAALSSLPGAAGAGTILCLNVGADDGSGKAPVHHHDFRAPARCASSSVAAWPARPPRRRSCGSSSAWPSLCRCLRASPRHARRRRSRRNRAALQPSPDSTRRHLARAALTGLQAPCAGNFQNSRFSRPRRRRVARSGPVARLFDTPFEASVMAIQQKYRVAGSWPPPCSPPRLRRRRTPSSATGYFRRRSPSTIPASTTNWRCLPSLT